MICIYNPDNQTRALLKEYEDILGSYEAAYYVLCLNNGNPLDQTPDGKKSDLFDQLLRTEGRLNAIRKKSMLYTKPFYDSFGDWTMGQSDPTFLDSNGEPKMLAITGEVDPNILDIMNNQFLRDDLDNTLSVNNYEEDPVFGYNTDPYDLDKEGVALQNILSYSYDRYVGEQLRLNKDKSAVGLRKARRKASHEWYKRKVKLIVREQQIALAKAFGLDFVTNNDGSIELRGIEEYDNGPDKEIKQLRIKFVQNLDYDPLDDRRRSIFGEMPLSSKYHEVDVHHLMHVADAVSDANHADMFTAKNGLIYISLNNGTCATVNKVLAYHYITTYYDSKLVLSAIDAIVPDKNASMMFKVNKLVERITSPGVKDATGVSILDKFYANNKELTKDAAAQAEFFNNFWREFDELNDQVINKGIKSDYARNKILSTLAAAIITNNKMPAEMSIDMQIPNDYYFRYMPSDKETLRKKLSALESILNTLLENYTNRIEHSKKTATVYVDQKQVARIQMLVKDIEGYNSQNMGNVRNAIIKFYETACVEMAEATDKLNEAENMTDRIESAKIISIVFSDTIGFYKAVSQNIDLILQTNPGILTPDISRLSTMFATDLKTLDLRYNILLTDTCFKIVNKYIDQYIGDDILSQEDKQRYIANCHRWLQNQSLHGDVAAYETILTMNSSSGSDMIRMAFDIIRNLDIRRDLEVRKKAEELMRMLYATKRHLISSGKAQTALLGNNFQRIYQELDENGKPTGFFTRKLNYGKFYKHRRSFIDSTIREIIEQIRKDIGDTTFDLEYDNRHNPIFPQDPFYDKYWRDFQLKLNHFDCTYANKLYTEEYYELRLKNLSRATINALSDLEERIDLILGPITKDGVPHPEELDQSDLIELIQLQMLQEGLYSRYYPTGEYKDGEDLKISEELRKFRALVKDKREYETDEDRYQTVFNNVPNEKKADFLAFMSHMQLSKLFWDAYNVLKQEYREQFPPECAPIFERMDEINKQRRELMLYSQTGEYNTANLEVLPDEVFLKIKDLDLEFRDLSEQLRPYRQQLGEDAKASPAEQLASFELYETVPGSDKTIFDKFLEDAQKRDEAYYNTHGVYTTENVRRALDLYAIPYIAPDGLLRYSPTSAFSYMTYSSHIDEGIVNRFNLDLTRLLKRTPNKVFNKLVGGEYMNTNFDKTSLERLQPKEKNPQYAEIMKDRYLEHLYNKMLELMSEANAMIPNSRNSSNYRLPQIGASAATIFSRCDIYNPLPAIQYGLDRALNVNETDEEINDDFYTLPDGTRVNNVPLRFILMLEDPSTITADVVGSVIQYYNMAVNFKLKSQAAPLLELIKQQIDKTTTVDKVSIQGSKTNQSSKLTNVLESRLYDRDAVWFGNGGKRLSTNQKRTFKIIKGATNVLVRAALSHNFISYTTGFFDASSRMFTNSVQGDNFNKRNWFKGISRMMGYLLDGLLLAGIGSHFPTNNASMLMSMLGISVGTAEYFTGTNKNRVRRSLKEVKTGMFGFRVSDYMINGALTTAICDNFRFYLNPDGSGTFLLENEWIVRYMKQHPDDNISTATAAYQKSKPFVDAFDYDSRIPIWGNRYNIRLKEAFDSVSEDELLNIKVRIRKIVENIAAKLNGNIPTEDKPGLHQNPIMRTLSTLRNYIINDYQTRWEYGESFLDADTSRSNIKELQARLDKLIYQKKQSEKLYKKIHKDRAKAIEQIDLEIDKLNKQLTSSLFLKTETNKKYMKDAIKAFLMGIPTGLTISGPTNLLLTAIFPAAHIYSFGITAIGTGIGLAVYLMYKNYTNGQDIKIDKKLSISDKIAALTIIKEKIMSQEEPDLLDQQIENTKKDLWEKRNLHNQRKGVYNYELRRKAYGYNRACGSAIITLMRQLKFFYLRKFADSWKDLSDVDLIKYTPKLSKIEKIGVRRILGDISMIMLWMILSSIMFGWRNDDPDNVLPAKIVDNTIGLVSKNDHVTRDLLSEAYYKADDITVLFWDAALNNDFVQGSAEWLYDKVTNGDKIPRDNNVFERMIESKLNMILGRKISVKTKTGEAVYKREANYKQFLELTKAYSALQTVRVFTELEQPYDPTSINDMLSTTSASNNVGFKMTEQAIQLGVDEANGISDKLIQRSPYTGFEKSQYHIAKSILKPTGLPTLHEETTIPGLDTRLRYSTSLGINSVLFLKDEDAAKNKKQREKERKRRKIYPRKPSYRQ